MSNGACPGCEECGLDEDPSEFHRECAEEPHFSWSPCDICNRPLGGDRYPAHYRDENDTIQHLNICTDCVYYLEYGQLDDQTMLEIAS